MKTPTKIHRREVLKGLGLMAASGLLPGCQSTAASGARVIVVGGGFAGVSCARSLKQLDPSLTVTLVEPGNRYVACPFSNLVISGERSIASQTFSYISVISAGVRHIPLTAQDLDPVSHQLTLSDGSTLAYDKLIMAPGISINYDALPGYTAVASQQMPHAWQAGPQTTLLARQLAAMRDGGTVVIAAPANPFRCPPGPYERASLIAAYLKKNKPKSKLLILDSKDSFSKKSLFQAAWQSEFGDLIEWQGLSDGARLVRVDADQMTLYTDFDKVQADVANVIPPQQAAKIALDTGIADRSGWCPIEAANFASTLAEDVHVIGDAAIANAMPKSAFSANAQAKLCALQVSRALRGDPILASKLINTCYSLVTPSYGISVAGVYTPEGNRWLEVEGAGGTSPADASRKVRALEADYAKRWFSTITQEVFG
jgi:NADPH-dependent 2,4-dienoyl-CoA reductase/sulfur reductase-like enzyme